MWISQRMHVAFGAGYFALRDFEDLGELRGVEISVSSGLNSPVARLRDQRWQPADLQIQTNTNEQVGIPQFQQKAGLRLDEMWILIPLSDGFHTDSVTAHLLGQRGQIGGGRDYIELLGKCQ